MKTILHLLLSFAFTSFGLAADKARESQTDDIREAVFRWQFDHTGSGQQTNAQVYFLEIGEQGDPTDAFMNRFAEHRPSVRKVSACSAGVSGVRDKKAGGRELVFRVTNMEWKSAAEVDVTGGYYEAGLSGSGSTYPLKKEKGRWRGQMT